MKTKIIVFGRFRTALDRFRTVSDGFNMLGESIDSFGFEKLLSSCGHVVWILKNKYWCVNHTKSKLWLLKPIWDNGFPGMASTSQRKHMDY